jgi:hypothetical protein
MNISVPHYDSRSLGEKLLAESRLNEGMITTIDPVDIPNGAVVKALNARVRLDKISRRAGKTNDAPTKPNNNKILGFVLFKRNDGLTYLIRLTKNSIHQRSIASWINYTAGVGGSLSGGDFDYFSLVVVLNKLFFANGVDKIQEIDVGSLTYKEAGPNSPKVKFATGFFNRVVGAYRVEGTEPDGPVSIVWSGDKASDKWPNDASPDISSGQSPLVESTSDLADFITGVFGGPNMLIVPREKSIWVATKQPSASNPFNFATALPGIGSDCPHAIEVIPGGLAFLDTRSAQIWAWSIGSPPEEIGTTVYLDIIKGIDDPSHVFSGYDTVEREFSIATPKVGSTLVSVWTYSFRTKGAWVYDEIDALSYIGDIDSPFSTILTMDELVGTFDSLVGSFDSLGVSAQGKPARYYGYTNGDILVEDPAIDKDNNVAYTTEIQSKDFKVPGVNTYISEISVTYQAQRTGNITLSYSKDSGVTWKVARTISTIVDRPRQISYKKNISAPKLRWRITATNGSFDILEYEIRVIPSGNPKESD